MLSDSVMLSKKDDSEIKGIKPYGDMQSKEGHKAIAKSPVVQHCAPIHTTNDREFVICLPDGSTKTIIINEDQFIKFCNKFGGLKPEIKRNILYMQRPGEIGRTYIVFKAPVDDRVVKTLIDGLTEFENMVDVENYTIS